MVAAFLFLLCFAVYLLTYDGGFTTTDERALFSGVDSLVKRGDFTINQMYWNGKNVGMYTVEGEMVPNYEPAQMVLAVPLYLLGRAVGAGTVQSVMLFNPIVTALTVAIFFLCLRELDYTRLTSLALSLAYAFGTIAWVYARFFFREPLMTLAYVVAAYSLFRYRREQGQGAAALAGLGAGLAIATKQVSVASLPSFSLLFLAYAWRTPRRRQLCSALAAGLPFMVILSLTKLYHETTLGGIPAFARNVVEFSTSPLLTRDAWADMAFAAYGLVLSPGKGLFAYSPVLILALMAVPWFLRRHPLEGIAIGLLALVHVAGYSRYITWWGGLSWGPRYLVPIVPFVLLAAAPLAEQLVATRRWVWRAVVIALLAVSFAVQVAGVSVDIRLYEEILGRTIRQQIPWFEVSMRAIVTDPAYSPILGQLSLLTPTNLDFAWVRVSEGEVSILAASLLLTLGLIALAAWGLAQVLRAYPRLPRYLFAFILTFLVGIPILLNSYYGDPRFDPQKASRFLFPLVAYLETHVAPGDLAVMNAPAQTDFFLNYFRSPVKWYGLDEESYPLRPQTINLLTKLEKNASRLWLMRDVHAWADPKRGIEQYLTEQAYKVEDHLFLDWMRVMAFSTPTERALVEEEGRVELGGQVRLESYRLEIKEPALTKVQVEECAQCPPIIQIPAQSLLHLSLRWSALRPLERDYTVFVQFLDEVPKVRLQTDRYPVDGFRPTRSWPPGQIVTDNYAFRLALPPGRYRLIVGMYDLSTGERLRHAEGGFVSLGEIIIVK
jgi:4-amino-4-deoxy-L-arabinose transferase-like glycosyltransferase